VKGRRTGPDLGPINPQEFQGLGVDDVKVVASVHEDFGEPNVADASCRARRPLVIGECAGSLSMTHCRRCDPGCPGPDDRLLRRVLGLPTPVRCSVRAAQAGLLPRRPGPASHGFARAVCPNPPVGTGTTASSRGMSMRDAGLGGSSTSGIPRWLPSL
jgi:hypothetical protein